ncbi:MAG TPA: hypothetical protein QGF58_19590 [Myxococcota bacterium]|nr:hypothetical protein [Myxococcota bacterium]
MASVARRIAYSAVVALALTPVLVEIGVRVWDPTPRRMVIRPGPELVVERVQGTPLWWAPEDAPRLREPECEGDRRVLIVGDSILKGWGVPVEESWSVLWREEAREDGLCVHNYASPGYGHAEEWALTQEYVPQLEPDLLVYEVYALAHPDHADVQRMVGGTIFDLRGLRVGPDGAPRVFAVPASLNHWLFANSYAYQYINLAAGSPSATVGSFVPAVPPETLQRVADFALEQGVEVAFVLCHRLDIAFPFLVDAPPPRLTGAREVAENNAHVHLVDTAELLADQDVTAVRLDECCHFNKRGQRLLAERLGAALEAHIPGQTPGLSPSSGALR